MATIAQIHLHPTAVEQICDILPAYADCHLAPIAAWADKVRMHMRWSSTLHYVNGVDDHPSDHCVFGEEGWQGKPGANVLSAIRNTTMWLDRGNEGAEEALKFLVHFVGDMHQPLHLTGRDKGGNGAKVKFDGRITSECLCCSFGPVPDASVGRLALRLGLAADCQDSAYDSEELYPSAAL